MSRLDVAVVGAGIGGLTAAIALRRKGVSVTVYEQAPQLLPIGASLAMGPNATRLLGALDLLGEIAGGGRYEDLLSHSISLRLYGVECLCLDLERLIRVKRAAGRPKDLEALAELEAILEEQKGLG